MPFKRSTDFSKICARSASSISRERARAYESSAVRRLGYLLELAGHEPQAIALDRFARHSTPLHPRKAAARTMAGT